MIHHIGEQYRYPKGTRLFTLIAVHDWIYEFKCGHRVTDCVFADLVRVKTGIQVFNEVQLELTFPQ